MSDLEQHILDKYGPVLGTKALHELMRYRYGSAKEVCNAISREQFPIPTYKDGRSRVANYRDVARHLESVLGMAATTGSREDSMMVMATMDLIITGRCCEK